MDLSDFWLTLSKVPLLGFFERWAIRRESQVGVAKEHRVKTVKRWRLALEEFTSLTDDVTQAPIYGEIRAALLNAGIALDGIEGRVVVVPPNGYKGNWSKALLLQKISEFVKE